MMQTRNFHPADEMADMAARMRQWIYDRVSKHLYSPDDFKAKYGSVADDHPIFFRVEFRDPTQELIRLQKEILELHTKWEIFSNKVVTHLGK